jgi:hypothetical protein
MEGHLKLTMCPPEYDCFGLKKTAKYFALDDRPLARVSQIKLRNVTILTT